MSIVRVAVVVLIIQEIVMPTDSDTNPQTGPTTRAAYGLPDLRKAIRAGARGIKKLMECAGLPTMYQNELSAGYGIPEGIMAALGSSREVEPRDKTGDESAEPLTDERLLQRTIDECLSYSCRQVLRPSRISLFEFRQMFLVNRAWLAHRKDGLAACLVWVCDQFIGAKLVSDVVKQFASGRHLELEDDRPISRFEKSVLRCLKGAAMGSIASGKAHLDLVRIFLREELRFLESVLQGIDEGQPVTSDDAERLGAFLSLGSVETVHDMEPGSTPWSFKLVFFPVFSPYSFENLYPSQMRIARLLAAPVAFDICLELSELSRGTKRKRYIRKCRAPSCRKLFFTSRATAKACKSTESGEVSPCKSEWDKYSRWMKNCTYDADTQWNDADVIKQFMQFIKSKP